MKNKTNNLARQYNDFTIAFSRAINTEDNISRNTFYNSLTFEMKDKRLLDLACGDGQDFAEYKKRGAICAGLDASTQLVAQAQKQHRDIEILEGNMASLPYANESFDIVVSKYAIGTAHELNTIFTEVARVLKPGGFFAYLTTHPLRLFLEQKGDQKDYFTQQNVALVAYGGAFTITEPSHTFNEFMSGPFLHHFDILSFTEAPDLQSANFPNRDIYPDFFIIVTKKR